MISKKGSLTDNVDIFRNIDKTWFFQSDRKTTFFSLKTIFLKWSQNNILSSKYCYYWTFAIFPGLFMFSEIRAKKIFSKLSQKNVLLFEILIFADICAKTDFFKLISKTSLSLKFWYFRTYGQKCSFSQNFDISFDVGKSNFLKEIEKRLHLVGEETIYAGLLKILDVGCSPHKSCMQQRQPHPKYYRRMPRAIYLFAAWLNTLPGICPCYQHHLCSCCSPIVAQVSFLDLRLRGCNASWKEPEQL